MSGRLVRGSLYVVLLLLFPLHSDLWQWNDARLVWGLPVGLAYHAAYCVVVSVVMGLLVLRVRR